MPTTELNLDTAFYLPITGVYEGNSFEMTFYRFQDEACTIAEDWPSADYTFGISEKQNGEPLLMTLASGGGGITIVGNALTVKCFAMNNLMKGTKPGKPYYYDVVADYGSGNTSVEGKGTITVNYSVAR